MANLSARHAEELNRLGQLQQIYSSDPASRRRNARILWVGIGVGLLGLAISVIILVGGRLQKDGGALVSGLLMAAFFLPLCGWRLRELARGSRVQVLVFSQGMAYYDRENLLACRWEEIESVQGTLKNVQVSGSVGARFRITVQISGGKQVRLDAAREHMAGMDVLFQRISAESNRHLFPRLLKAVESGETVPFGELAISRQGVHHRERLLHWEEVGSVSNAHFLFIRRKDAGRMDFWSRRGFLIPNLEVFLGLAKYYLSRVAR
jgi:hypothetical protein